MRAIPLALVILCSTGCGSDTLDHTVYRRLVDTFDSYDQCLAEGAFAACYQTLTFCADGRAYANLDFRQEGEYVVRQQNAIATLPSVTVIFDLERQQSPQLPGRHAWELVTPLSDECGS